MSRFIRRFGIVFINGELENASQLNDGSFENHEQPQSGGNNTKYKKRNKSKRKNKSKNKKGGFLYRKTKRKRISSSLFNKSIKSNSYRKTTSKRN